jgi:two-component system, NarL family, response regulator NreC
VVVAAAAVVVEGLVRVLVVDDHPVVRGGVRGNLAGAIWIEVVGEARLVLTPHAPERSLVMEAGAFGFVRKANAHQDLLPAMRSVLRGEVFLDSGSHQVLVRHLERTLAARRRLAALTRQECDILRLTAAGHIAQEVGQELYLSPHTVASYRSRAMRKLGLEHRSELVHFALESELIGAE